MCVCVCVQIYNTQYCNVDLPTSLTHWFIRELFFLNPRNRVHLLALSYFLPIDPYDIYLTQLDLHEDFMFLKRSFIMKLNIIGNLCKKPTICVKNIQLIKYFLNNQYILIINS